MNKFESLFIKHITIDKLLILFFTLYIFIIQFPANSAINRKNYYDFHNLALNAQIDSIVRGDVPYDVFSVNTDPTIYCIKIFLCGENASEEFGYFAKKGDGIIKQSQSDTFLLIKGDKNYLCRIAKYKD